MKTGIIISCYNEERRFNINAFVNFIKLYNNYHLCFVNNGSIDDTLSVLQTIKEKAISRVSIINVSINTGKPAAVRLGAKHLYSKQNINYIGFIDTDSFTDFNDFQKLSNTLHNFTPLL